MILVKGFEILGISKHVSKELAGYLSVPLRILLVIFLALLVVKVERPIVNKSFKLAKEKLKPDARNRKLRRALTLANAVSSTVKVIVLIISFFLILQILGVNLVPFLAGATVIGAALAFGAQSLIKDYLSGFLLISEDQLAIGDLVKIQDVEGIVESVSLRTTTVVDANGNKWHIANGDIRLLGNLKKVKEAAT